MIAYDLRQVVAVGVDRVRVVPWKVPAISGETAAILRVVPDHDGRQLPAESVIEERTHGKARRKRRIIQRRQEDVIRGVARDELVQKCRRKVCVQPGHETRARPDEFRVDALETGTLAPQRIWRLRLPGIM